MVFLKQVVEFVKSEKYARFTRIIFDTAPTGHTLRLLTVPDFVEKSLNKIIRLRQKLSSAGSALRSLFGASEQQDAAVQKLEKIKVCVCSHSQSLEKHVPSCRMQGIREGSLHSHCSSAPVKHAQSLKEKQFTGRTIKASVKTFDMCSFASRRMLFSSGISSGTKKLMNSSLLQYPQFWL